MEKYIYVVIEDIQEENFNGDINRDTNVVIAFSREEDAIKYVKENNDPHVYGRCYAGELHRGELDYIEVPLDFEEPLA